MTRPHPTLRVGLTGGIGSGKSSVAGHLRELGAVIVDADRIARDVVAPGTGGLAAVLDRFGGEVRAADGSLDRAALARIVFGDANALRDLEAITHPLIWAETARQFAAVPADRIAVHDMPLLVEKQMSAEYHLVIAVLTDAELRVRRLVEHRGLGEDDARARIRTQVDDAARRAAADVVLDNNGTPEHLLAATTELYAARLLPFAANLTTATSASRPVDPPDADTVVAQGRRVAARVARALGADASAAARWSPARWEDDRLVLDIPTSADLDARAAALAAAGFPSCRGASGEMTALGNCDPHWPSAIRLAPAAPARL